MKFPSSARGSLLALLLTLFALSSSVQGQAIQQMNSAAIQAMKAGDWQEAHKVLVGATTTYESRGLQLFGPRFGWFWYFRGFSALQLGKFDDALKSFETCYRDYKNIPPTEDKTPSVNQFHKKSLIMAGHAAKSLEMWKKSNDYYQKFLKEKSPSETFDQGKLYLSLATNHFSLGEISKGQAHLQTAIDGKNTFPTQSDEIVSAFTTMVVAALERNSPKPLIQFLEKNRFHLELDPFKAHNFGPLFLKLAQDARNLGKLRLASDLYSLVPSTLASMDDLQARISLLDNYERPLQDGSTMMKRSDLEADLAKLRKEVANLHFNEVYAYLNIAVIHEEAGNIRGAYAVYQIIERYFENAKVTIEGEKVGIKEQVHYHLVRTTTILGKEQEAGKYGAEFLNRYPNSEYANQVRELLLTGLFFSGQYEEAERRAELMLPDLEPSKPSAPHDICLFVLGGSKYYLGKYKEAEGFLNDYVAIYKIGKGGDDLRVMATRYFRASNNTKLQNWTRATALLESFLVDFSNTNSNIYYPFALFDLASSYFALEKFAIALESVDRIIEEFPNISLIEQSYSMRGNILESLERFADAEESYRKGYEIASQKGNKVVAGECLTYLITLLGDSDDEDTLAKVVPLYEKYWESYAKESSYQITVSVAGMPAMRAAGKAPVALKNLQESISRAASQPNPTNLDAAVGSYTEEYLKDHSSEELKEHFYRFPGITRDNMAVRALLRIAIIGVFEKEFAAVKKKKNAEGQRALSSRINVLFNELRNDFRPKDLSNFILVKVGDFIRKTSNPKAAQVYYDEALGRKDDKSHRISAIFGLADINSRGSSVDKKEAIKLLAQVTEESTDVSEQGEALYLTAKIHKELGNHRLAVENALSYIKNRKFRAHSVACRFIVAEGYAELGEVDDALIAYQQVWSVNMGAIRYSAPAIKAWMKMLWDRGGVNPNGQTDRQISYEKGYRYVEATLPVIERATSDEKIMHAEVVELVARYESSNETVAIEDEEN